MNPFLPGYADQYDPEQVGAPLVRPPTPVAAQPAADAPEELPPAPPPAIARPALDPDLAGFLQRGKRPQFDWSQTAPAPGQQTEDPNRSLKVVDAIASGLSGMRPGGRGHQYDTGYWQGVDQERERKAMQARAAVEADPSSEPSAAARRSMAPALKSMGLTDEEIGTLSAADIKKLGAGNVVMGLVQARQKAQAELAKQKATLDAEDRKLKHDQQMADYTGNTPETKKEIAALQGGMVGQREMQQAVLASNLGLRNQQAMADLNEQNRVAAEARAEQRKIDEENRRHAYEEAHPKAGAGEPLRVEDLEGTGWKVDDPASAQRIVNKRSLTKEVLPQLTDARTALESLDKLIANREKYGSDPARWDPKVAEENDLYMATVKQNYKSAMKMPNTDASEAELKHLFPDPNAVTGKGFGGTVQGLGAAIGVANDPVLEELRAARAEAAHNLTAKIPIPSLRYIGSGKYKANASAGEGAGAEQGVPAASAAPPPGAPKGVRVRDPKTGRTGTLKPGAPVPDGLEVIQ